MNFKSLSSICATVALAMGATSAVAESNTSANHLIFCTSSKGTPITMARTVEGKNLTIFHWRSEVLPKSLNPQQLCDSVSAKLNKYAVQGEQIAAFRSYDQGGLPAVCAEINPGECSSVLFTLAPSEHPIDASNKVLEGILDDQLKQERRVPNTRGVQGFAYPVSFWKLMGFKFLK